MKTTRRYFLSRGAALAGAGVLANATASTGEATPKMLLPTDAPADPAELPPPLPSTRKGDMLYRALGRTGEQVSLIGLGGFHIGVQRDEQESIRIIRTALDHGINFLDNSWDYNDGNSERRMGKALQGGYRGKAFLMTKIDGRTKQAAQQQLDESLQRLQTDHLDLLQFHEILRMEDPDRVFAPGGALEAVFAAKQAGKVRYVGFTGHKDPLVHLRMLEVAAQHGFHFDTAQMPLNVMDAHFRSFAHAVVPVLVREQIGVLGMKAFGSGAILDHVVQNKLATPTELLHYAMNLPTAVVITGMDSLPVLNQGLEAVRTFQPMTRPQVASLLARTRVAAVSGSYERFKTTAQFDSTVQHPDWLG